MDSKRLDELIHLADKKEIPYSRKQLEKMTDDRLEQIYQKHREEELDSLNETIVDTVIGKFDEFMKGFGLVSKHSKLGKKLQDKKLFRQDMKSFVGLFTPLFPYVGILEGAVCVANEIITMISLKAVLMKGVNKIRLKKKPDSHETTPDAENTKL